jgi:hypothetical protein
MANQVLRSPYAALVYLPGNGDDAAVADERRALAQNCIAWKYDSRWFGTSTSFARQQGIASRLLIPAVLSLLANRLLDHA